MKKIKMIRTEKGSIDGFTINKYLAGVEYNLPMELADAFLNIGSAELITETMSICVDKIEMADKLTEVFKDVVDNIKEKIETPEKIESNDHLPDIKNMIVDSKDKPETVKKSKKKRKYTKRNK